MNPFRNWVAGDFEQQAAHFCVLARDSYGIELDYSPATLNHLEAFLETQFHPGSADDNAALIVAMGCYVGEVIIRTHGGHWSADEEHFHSPAVVIEGKLQVRTFPVSRVWKRFEYGNKQSLEIYYTEVRGLIGRLEPIPKRLQ